MADLITRSRDEIRAAYRDVFCTPPGAIVLADLERKARANKIDGDAPNPHAAIYRVAQQDLLIYINRMIEPKETDASRSIIHTRV